MSDLPQTRPYQSPSLPPSSTPSISESFNKLLDDSSSDDDDNDRATSLSSFSDSISSTLTNDLTSPSSPVGEPDDNEPLLTSNTNQSSSSSNSPPSTPSEDVLKKSSNGQVAVNISSPRAIDRSRIIISFVGAGILSLPHAFSQAGWLLGVGAMMTVSGLSFYAMMLLIRSRKFLENKPGYGEIKGYGDIGRVALGPSGETLVNTSLVISQTGFATAYMIFIIANIHHLFSTPSILIVILSLPPLTFLSFKREMKALAPYSLIADIANLVGLIIVFQQDFHYYPINHSTIQAFNPYAILQIIGISAYCFEGIGMVLPLESSALNPNDFPKLLFAVLSGITTLMCVFGVFGYLAFGEDTLSPITLNMSNGSVVAVTVKLSLCLGLFLTYPVMLFPVAEILQKKYTQRLENETNSHLTFRENKLRFTVIIISCLIAWAIPDFGLFIGFVGSSICVLLAFIFPAYFHLKIVGEGMTRWERWADYFIIGFGCFVGVIGTISSGYELVDGLWNTHAGGRR